MRALFLKFMIFSLFGYILECVYSSIVNRKITLNRGFLMGPYCPIYGNSILLVDYFISMFNNIYFQIILSFILITAIEYASGTLLEKFFNKKWWDYSRKKYNIKGRVCLENIIIFGLGIVLISDTIIPILRTFLFIENNIYIVASFAMFVVFCIDFSVSLKIHYQNANKFIKCKYDLKS